MRIPLLQTFGLLLLAFNLSASQAQTDAFQIVRPPGSWRTLQAPTDCRAQIAKVICLVEPATNANDPLTRPCLTGGAAYASHFEAHYDRANPMIKQMYCHLERIWVEKNFSATAYATSIVDIPGGPVTGGAIGIRQEVLDSPNSMDRWMTWKEETNFGGSKISTDPLLGVVTYKSNNPTKAALLDYVLDHEFGHLFDFANSLNPVSDCAWQKQPDGHYKQIGTCTFAKGSFGELSWITERAPIRPESRFPGSGDLCFYECDASNHIDPKFAPELYSGLMKSSFISAYASSNAMEDWAETFTNHIAYEEAGLQMNLEVDGKTYSLRGHYYSTEMKQKRDYVRTFVSGKYKYPGEL